MPIVTIGRELGAGGSRVARIVAESLGAELVDRSLIAEVARRLGFPEPAVERADEYAESTEPPRASGSERLTPTGG